MQKSQGAPLLVLFASAVLFLFSLALIPAAEMYCQFQRPARVLLVLQLVLFVIALAALRRFSERALTIGSVILVVIGLVLNVCLLVMAHSRC